MEIPKRTRKLNYLDDAISFMKSLIRDEKKDTAKAIKSVLLEICREGTGYPNLEFYTDVENMYRLHMPALKNDDTYHQGFRVILIIMERHVLVTSIEPEYS